MSNMCLICSYDHERNFNWLWLEIRLNRGPCSNLKNKTSNKCFMQGRAKVEFNRKCMFIWGKVSVIWVGKCLRSVILIMRQSAAAFYLVGNIPPRTWAHSATRHPHCSRRGISAGVDGLLRPLHRLISPAVFRSWQETRLKEGIVRLQPQEEPLRSELLSGKFTVLVRTCHPWNGVVQSYGGGREGGAPLLVLLF